MSSDPLLRAIASGDRNCPDGASLARLGELTRAAGANRQVDLSDRVLRAIASNASDAADEADGDAAVDSWLAGRSDPVLDRLHALTHVQPRPVDLSQRVRHALAPASLRLTPQQAERTGRRWRLIVAIAAAHVVAILVFTGIRETPSSGSTAVGATATARATDPTITAPTWERLRQADGDVLAPRRSNLARETARADARMGDTAEPIQHMLAWLIARQDPTSGRIAAGSGDRAVASQALAALALLGEGAGDQTRLMRARLALGPVAAAMAGAEALSPATLSAAALALVEGALVTKDAELALTARAGLLRLTRELPSGAHEGGLAGFAWLAIEAADAGKLELPRGLVEAARSRIARLVPAEHAGAGRVGLAAYARIVLGLRSPELDRQLAELGAEPPAADRDGHIDPLVWFFAGLAVHAEGGPTWTSWAEGLRASVLPRLVVAGPGQARLPAAAVRHAGDDDVLATALGVLALQTPYRYAVPARE